MRDSPAIREFETVLGYNFRDPAILACALTHRSLARETARDIAQSPVPDNERLEFLGDAVLNLTVAEALFAAHPEWSEGELTRVRAQLVSRQHMARVAEAIHLGGYLRLGKGEDRGGLRGKSTVLSDSLEAVIGALFLDGGLDAARAFARQWVIGEAVEQLADELRAGAALGNYKSALQERLQAARAGVPVYRLKSESGPPHRRSFTIEARVKGPSGAEEPLARGSGSTKKLAEQQAARRALESLMNGELSQTVETAFNYEDSKAAAGENKAAADRE